MDQKEIIQKIITVIKPYVKNEAALQNISHSTRFIEDLRINSSRLVDIILSLEDEFGLTISDDEADRLLTMGNAIELIQQKFAVNAGNTHSQK